jgi:ankyrin repeat protein
MQSIRNGGSSELAFRVLSWLSNAITPLTIEELTTAVSVVENSEEQALDSDSLPRKEILTDICAGLITIEENTGIVRLTHYTTQEYLLRRCIIPEYLGISSGYHTVISATYLMFHQFSQGPCRSEEDYKRRIRENKFLEHAAANLTYYISSSSERKTKDVIMKFVQNTESALSYLQAQKCYHVSNNFWWDMFPRGWHPLHYACYLNHQMVILNLLNTNKPKPSTDCRSIHGETPLHIASQYGRKGAVEVLIKNGADVAATDENGLTPLVTAAHHGNEGIARLLIENGAEVSVSDTNSLTPLHHAAWQRHEAIARLMVEHGGDISAVDKAGRTPLHWAASSGSVEVAMFLINNGSDVSAVDESCQTPLGLACERDNKAVAWLLIQNGADIGEIRYDAELRVIDLGLS